ncbi:phosphotransferase [Rhizobium sp. 1AS11]|uniref:phosphotransferase n=1 Tax=Rhizobium acaciae TaxID=2989736 RepID=UPI002220392E|nr:phosphotransferase [Rhizobium acaciae]MCW1408825.1 phosphotransferase [Rhizobium acaciae]MCW1741220.1 phosphotransferase [Rhizobium acaciae]MCW1749495.1 phosphotransferase [Rhizobium acaciae]
MKALGRASTVDEKAAEAAIRAVPGWANADMRYAPGVAGVASPTHRAVDSQNWFVARGDAPASYFLKILHADQSDFIDLDRSVTAARHASTLGLTPAPLWHSPEMSAVVFDRLPEAWHTARMDDLRKRDVLESVIATKSTLHGSRPLGETWTVFDRIRVVEKALVDAAIAEVAADGWWMRECVGDIEAAIIATGFDEKPAHADGLASNIMIAPDGRVQLVDFDEARNVDPFYDIGILLNEAFQFDSEMQPALEIFEGQFRQTSLNRCRLYAIADDLFWGMWGMLMDKVSPRGGIEFLKYAQWRLLRCRMALRNPRFEFMLRTL